MSPAEPENNYDYAGQDPINGYDLDGSMPIATDPTMSIVERTFDREVRGCASRSASVAYYWCVQLHHDYGSTGFDIGRGVAQFARGVGKAPKTFTAGLDAFSTGIAIISIATIGDVYCEAQTAGAGTLACYYTTTKAYALGAGSIFAAGHEFHIVWRAGEPRRRKR